jgi:hypothetical protein
MFIDIDQKSENLIHPPANLTAWWLCPLSEGYPPFAAANIDRAHKINQLRIP